MNAVLIGNPLGHSLSPRIHALISELSGLPCDYTLRPLEPEAVRPFIRGMRQADVQGMNVTIPYKLAAYESVDALSAEARAVGAVNTVAAAPNGLVGHNTDYYGFGAMLRYAGIGVGGRRCVVLGSGGAARAAVAYLVDAGAADVIVVSRDAEEAARKFPGIRTAYYEELGQLSGGLVVNTTPLGMHPHPEGCPAGEAAIARFEAAADLVYNPRRTQFLSIAARLGLSTADGLYMLAAQAVRARQIWHGTPIGEDVEREVYRRLDIEMGGEP